MRVYLVPVGRAAYRLYVEITDHEAVPPESAEPPRGRIGRLIHRFRATLAEAEAERLRRERGEAENGSGLWRWIMRRIAEAIAEQRLLWHLRNQKEAELHHPTDVDGEAAMRELGSDLTREASRHLRWLIVDAVLAAITGPVFFFVPGPNVVAWYFTFRAVGHFLSWRGARCGLTGVAWRAEPSAPLTDVRQAIQSLPHDRRARLDAIARALGLQHFTGFVERVSARTA